MNLGAGPCGRRWLVEVQENLGEAVRQSEENNILDLLARAAQPRAQNIDQSYRDFRIIPQYRDEIAALDNHQFTIVDSNRVSGALPSVEKCNFPEEFTGDDQVENCVFPLFGRRTDSHGTGSNRIKLRADIAFVKYGCAFFYSCRNDTGRDPIDDRMAQILEKWVGAKQRMLVE
jgi:hypothetical protein